MGISFGTLADLGVVRYSQGQNIFSHFTEIQNAPQTSKHAFRAGGAAEKWVRRTEALRSAKEAHR